jgi:hypothetical protein
VKTLLAIFIFYSFTATSEIIGKPMIEGVIHKITKRRVVIRIPSGEKTKEYRIHIDRKWLPSRYKELVLNQDISFERTMEMVKKDAILQLTWNLK